MLSFLKNIRLLTGAGVMLGIGLFTAPTVLAQDQSVDLCNNAQEGARCVDREDQCAQTPLGDGATTLCPGNQFCCIPDPGAMAAPAAPVETGPGVAATLPDPLSGVNLPQLIGNIIRTFTGIAGAAALLFFVYGGIMYILSGGEDAKVKAARTILKNASIGLILIFGAYFFTSAIIGGLLYNPQTISTP